MASLRSPAHPVLLAITVLGAAALVWMLIQGEDDGSDVLGREAGPPAAEERSDAASAPGAPPRTRARGSAARSGRGIPRVLPPDAAVEDVRDALALAEGARQDALAEAVRAIGRLATQGETALKSLVGYARTVEDPAVRGVVVASLGTERSRPNVRRLCNQLADGGSKAERLGALIALAHPAGRTAANEEPEALAARSVLLGGLPYQHVALPVGRDVLGSGARFMDSADSLLARDAAAILLHSVDTHSEWAALLVVDDARMCAWYTNLPEADRRRVRDAALKHDGLREKARKLIRSSE